MENINIYTKIKFPEFFELVKHVLNEDVFFFLNQLFFLMNILRYYYNRYNLQQKLIYLN